MYDDLKKFIKHLLILVQWNKLPMISQKRFLNDVERKNQRDKIRKSFASAITSDGFVDYLDLIFAETDKRYIIKGSPAQENQH